MKADWNALLERVRAIKAGKSRSYVADAVEMAGILEELIVEHASYCIQKGTYTALHERWINLLVDHRLALENLTSTQARCTELSNEVRWRGRHLEEIMLNGVDAKSVAEEGLQPPPEDFE